MKSPYLELYTLLYAVGLNTVLTTAATRHRAFIPRGDILVGLARVAWSALIIVLAPVVFFVFAYPVVSKFPSEWRTPSLFKIIIYVLPIYGWYQGWFFSQWLGARWGICRLPRETAPQSHVVWALLFCLLALGPIVFLWLCGG